MVKEYKDKIKADGVEIAVISTGDVDDYISLTDIARKRTVENPGYIIQNWMRNRSTVDFLGLWEQLHKPDFNYLEFEAIKSEAGTMQKMCSTISLNPPRWSLVQGKAKKALVRRMIIQKAEGLKAL